MKYKSVLAYIPLAAVLLLLFGVSSRQKFSNPLPQKSHSNKSVEGKTIKAVPVNIPVSSPSSSISSNLYKVVNVIDGDTIQVEMNGKSETVRLIGIDAPETTRVRRGVIECFGAEASRKAREILTGKNVLLELDATQAEKDRYGRLLRYVFLQDGTNFNELMIREGFAHEYTYQNPYKYQILFKQAETQAQEQKRGLWADDACTLHSEETKQQPHESSQPSLSVGNKYQCDCNKSCTNIPSCEEAYFQLRECGCSARDSDQDGIPCESLC